ASAPVAPVEAHGSPTDDAAGAAAPVKVAEAAPAPAAAPEASPYADPDFKVQPRKRTSSLQQALVERSEVKARKDLLRETQQHLHRSQYDCEAADRASRYIKAGLDVWGFAMWQMKYFPMESYKGATLPQCKHIEKVIDPSWLDLQSTVAQQK